MAAAAEKRAVAWLAWPSTLPSAMPSPKAATAPLRTAAINRFLRMVEVDFGDDRSS